MIYFSTIKPVSYTHLDVYKRQLVAEAKAQVEDMSVRYNTFAQAEASIINHAVIIPYGVEGLSLIHI